VTILDPGSKKNLRGGEGEGEEGGHKKQGHKKPHIERNVK
jgi:hypothetical protein